MSRRHHKKRRRFSSGYYDKAWADAHPIKLAPASPLPEITALMHAKSEFFEGTALWRRKYGLWTCVQASEHLRWLIGMMAKDAKFLLISKGFFFTFKQDQFPKDFRGSSLAASSPEPVVRPARAINRATSDQILGGSICRLSRRPDSDGDLQQNISQPPSLIPLTCAAQCPG